MLRTWSAGKLYAWDWQGLGGPNTAIQVHPYFLIIAVLSYVLPSKAILVVMLMAATALSTIGMALLARRLFAAAPVAMACSGILYALAPFVVDELVAGHIEILLSYAAVPWVAYASLGKDRFSRWLFALALAWTTLHIQFFLFALLLVAVIIGLQPFRALWTKIVLAVLTITPYAWGLLRPASASALHAMQTSVPWLFTQSTRASFAIQGTGYFRSYWESAITALPPVHAYGWLYPIAVITALLVSPRLLTVRLTAVFAIGVLLLMGLTGPLAKPLSWLTQHVLATSIFRELHHATVLVTFSGALCAAVALSRFRNERITYPIALTLTALAISPYVSGGVINQVGSIVVDEKFSAFLQSIAAAQRASRFYLAPGFNPAGPAGSGFSGVDPLAYPVGNALPFWTYAPTSWEASLIWSLESGGVAASTQARAYGISAIIGRDHYESKLRANIPYTMERRLKEFPGVPSMPRGWSEFQRNSPSQKASIFRIFLANDPSGIVLLSRAPLRGSDIEARPSARFDTVRGANVNAGWVSADDWWFLDRRLASRRAYGALTFAPRSTLRILCGPGTKSARIYFWGEGSVDGVHVSEAGAVLNEPCASLHTQVMPKGFLAAAVSDAPGAGLDCELVQTSQLRTTAWPMTSRQGDTLQLGLHGGCDNCTIALIDNRDDGWRLSLNGVDAPPNRTCGAFSAWRTTIPANADIKLHYAPDSTALLLDVVAALAWLWMLAAATYTATRRA